MDVIIANNMKQEWETEHFSPDLNALLREDSEFWSMEYYLLDHQHRETPPSQLHPRLVSQFPLDYIYAFDLS